MTTVLLDFYVLLHFSHSFFPGGHGLLQILFFIAFDPVALQANWALDVDCFECSQHTLVRVFTLAL